MQCPYYFKFYSTQSLSNHVKKSDSWGEVDPKTPSEVKVRCPKCPKPAMYVSEATRMDVTTDETATVPIDL